MTPHRSSSVGRLRRLAALLALLSLAGCAMGENVVGANWRGPPTSGLQDFTPAKAYWEQVAGFAVLACVAGEGGQAGGCVPLAESPQGWGFADAALRMQDRLVARETPAGEALPKPGETFRIPIQFCPPAQRPACASRLRAEHEALGARMQPIDEAVEAGRCGEAREAAAAIGQPLYLRYIEGKCGVGGR